MYVHVWRCCWRGSCRFVFGQSCRANLYKETTGSFLWLVEGLDGWHLTTCQISLSVRFRIFRDLGWRSGCFWSTFDILEARINGRERLSERTYLRCQGSEQGRHWSRVLSFSQILLKHSVTFVERHDLFFFQFFVDTFFHKIFMTFRFYPNAFLFLFRKKTSRGSEVAPEWATPSQFGSADWVGWYCQILKVPAS